MSPRRLLSFISIVAILAVGMAACGSNDSSTSDASSSSATPSASAVATTQPPTTVAASGVNYSTADVTTPAGKEISYLTDLRAASQPAGDRVTFQFDGPVPGYTVKYITPPLVADGSGANMDIKGAAILQVVFQQATGVKLTGGYTPTYTGPARFSTQGTTSVEEIVRSGDFEAVLGWGIGLKTKTGFAVSTLANPSRVVIDFQGS